MADFGKFMEMDDPVALKAWMREYMDKESESDKQSPVSHHVIANPRVSSFAGIVKGDQVSYDVWKYEVNSLLEEKIHSKEAITVAARKSLKGEVANIAMRLGVKASVEVLLQKLDGIYGTVEPTQSLLGQFYSAEQSDEEDVATWACRLEDLLERARRNNKLSEEVADEMLRTRFWSGLKPHLCEASRHKLDVIKSFDDLLVEVRRIELEHQRRMPHSKLKTHSKSATATSTDDLSELKGMVHKLMNTVKSIQDEVSSIKENATRRRREFPSMNRSSVGRTGEHSTRGNLQSNNNAARTCWSCGQTGHLSYDCRSQRNLNDHRPTAEGQQWVEEK